MLCNRCRKEGLTKDRHESTLLTVRLGEDGERLSRLICERCGAVLPPSARDASGGGKSSQLGRFGLASDDKTLLEP